MKSWMKYGVVALILIGFTMLFFWWSAPPSQEELQEQQRVEEELKKKEKEKLTAEEILKKEVEAAIEREKNRRPIPINPEGTYLIHHLFKAYDKTKKMKPMQSPIASNLPKNSSNAFPNVYMLVGDGAYLNYDDADELMSFVEMGNVAFISVSELDYALKSQLFWGEESFTEVDKCMDVNFYHDTMNMIADYHWFYEDAQKEAYSDSWNFWNVENLKFDEYAVLSYATMCDDIGTNEKKPICVRINIGEGQLFLHVQPEMFNNRILMNDIQGIEYAERVFSHIPRGNIYWHTLNGRNSHQYLARKGREEGAYGDGSSGGDNSKRRTSPLQFILDSTALRWALYLLLIGLLFYIIFQAKRRRKIIPAGEKRTNSTVEFADTVSELYYQERRHDKLIRHLEAVFMDFVRNKYYMTSAKPDSAYITGLAKKSGIEEEKVKQIYTAFNDAKRSGNVNDEFLIKLHDNIENFYKNCN
ncbi:MAG: hypothetical protein ACI9J3_002420 [Parvicellaceae bacterium]|jgi:hypothetical protein